MTRRPKDDSSTVDLGELRKKIDLWSKSKKGVENLKETQTSAINAAKYLDTETEIDPSVLEQTVNL